MWTAIRTVPSELETKDNVKKSIFENLILFLKFKLASSSTENTLSLYKKTV